MKKKAISLLLFLSLLFPAFSFATDATATLGTVERFKNIDGKFNRVVIPITFVANSGTAAMATYTLNATTHGIKGWYLYKVKTDPGSTGPTNGAWDLDITDANGYLVSRNLVDDRSSTATQEVIFVSGFPICEGNWAISIGDNAVNSAEATIYLTFVAD